MDSSWIKEIEKYYNAGVNNIFYVYGNTNDTWTNPFLITFADRWSITGW